MATEYRIDKYRGSDSNDGIAAPWASLSKIATVSASPGDAILLASDSDWEITAHINISAGWGGTPAAPITIGRFFPTGVNSGRPMISRRRAIAANEWTYDAGNNGWYVTWFGVNVGWGSYIKIGGAWGTRQEAALPLSSVEGAWKDAATGRVYVYAPAGTNPTDYYGSVYFAPHERGCFSFSSTGTNVILEDIDTEEGGGLISYYSNSGTREFLVRRCGFSRTGLALYHTVETAGRAKLSVVDCEFSDGVCAYVATYSPSTVGFGGLDIRRSTFRGGNEGYPQGNIYMQARGAPSIVAFNEFDGPKYGTWSHQNDGAAIYAEIGSGDVVALGNVIRNAMVAMQDNSGRKTTWMGNLTVNCKLAMKCQDDNAVGATDHRYWNNSNINVGAPIAPQGPNSASGLGWWGFQNLSGIDIRNSLFTLHPSAAAGAAVMVGTGASGTIANNAHSGGFSAMAQTYLGGASPISPTGTVTDDPLLDESYRLTEGSPCIGAGQYLPGVKHFGGASMNPASPDIGAHRYFAARTLADRHAARLRG